ncbi:PREDICTED: pentatricopeptide repeat-containing protein At2g17670 isoform X2 [Tarenaya hassleriana]|uniref:pentatricopeptide repeat-containing protein At2g17670 isoform X2 n=1 Tax=Tarenaya hassleriana TaxID=28532 RepID=UPI00053C2B6C|nr:PREDICTED: pentatricopeptide repeat-containing protein At2g17670 isoform X2 [Tarenaya hassleriana]
MQARFSVLKTQNQRNIECIMGMGRTWLSPLGPNFSHVFFSLVNATRLSLHFSHSNPCKNPRQTFTGSEIRRDEDRRRRNLRKMGKIPSFVRSSMARQLVKKPAPASAAESPAPPRDSPRKAAERESAKLSRKIQGPGVPFKNPFKTPDLSDAKKLFNSIVSTARIPLDVKFHNSVLQSYSLIATVDDTMGFFRHITKMQPDFSPERSTFHILLSKACRAPDSTLPDVHRVLNLMFTHGCEPNQVSTDIAVRSLCESGRVDEAVDLVKELSEKHSPPDTYTYNFLVKHLCKCRSLSAVYGFVDEMRSSFDIKPDLVTYTILIDNVCNSKNLREAMRLVSALSDSGFKPDCFVYNTIMKGYCTLSKGSEAIGVYKKMKEEGVEPDMITYNTLIFGLSKSGRVDEARKYLKAMIEAGHVPDAVTYTSLMNGMCRKGDALGAMSLLEEMEGEGCSPNSCTYNTLLHGLCKARLLEKGVELYGVMKSVDSKSLTDVAAYSTLESTVKWLKKAKEQGLAV